MSEVLPTLGAALAVIRRDLKIMLSYRLRFVTQVVAGFFSLTLFYYISRLVRVEVFDSPDDYYAFAVVGLIALQVMNSTLLAPPNLVRQELVAGTFERLVVSPFGPVSSLLSMMVFPVIYALLTAVFMLAFAGLVFGVDVQWSTLPVVIPVSLLAALSFAPFGAALLALVIVFKQAVSGTAFVVAGLSLIAGLYFPVSVLPDWIEWASEVQPFTPAVDLMRWAMVGDPLDASGWLEALKLLGFAAVLLPLAVVGLTAAIRASRRRGTIIEY